MLQPDLRILQHYIILWSISRSTRASSWIITSVQQLESPQVFDGCCERTGERATTVDRSPVTSSGTTELRSHGNPSFRSRWRFQLVRRSTTRHWCGGGHLSASTAAGHGPWHVTQISLNPACIGIELGSDTTYAYTPNTIYFSY